RRDDTLANPGGRCGGPRFLPLPSGACYFRRLSMRELPLSRLTDVIAELCKKACTELPGDVVENLSKALGKEKSEVGRETLRDIKTNLQIAKDESVPLCQDTGFTVVVLDIGQEVH